MTELAPLTLVTGGAVASHYAAQTVFGDYLRKLAPATLKAIQRDLAEWCNFLYAGQMIPDPDCAEQFLLLAESWTGVTWGQVKGFQEWLLQQGQAIATINRRVATVRAFCRLAAQAGTLSAGELRLVETVKGMGGKAARNIDEKRDVTRIGYKKPDSVLISKEHARLLKTNHDPDAQGVKDRLLLCILIDLGLRASEVVTIERAHVNLEDETILIYRRKTDYTQTLRMTRDVRSAMRSYLDLHQPAGKLLDHSVRSLTARVQYLGKRLGYDNLSAHDMRHYLATKLAREGLSTHSLMEAMGWRSLATAQHYIEASAIGNSAAAALIDA